MSMRYKQAVILAGWVLLFPLVTEAAGETTSALPQKSEEAIRKEFHIRYWDVVSSEREKALDLLLNAKEQSSHWILYTVSFWDQEPTLRRKAFRMLTNLPDDDGQLAYLAAQSFRQEKDPDVRAEKARMMAGLRFKWHALNELCAIVGGRRYPVYEYPYYGTDDYYQPIERWIRVPQIGSGGLRSGGGIGVVHGTWNPDLVRDQRNRLEALLYAINRLGRAEFKVRYNVGDQIRKWWQLKNAEFVEVDRRLKAEIAAERAAQGPALPEANPQEGRLGPAPSLKIPFLEKEALKKKEDLDEEEDE